MSNFKEKILKFSLRITQISGQSILLPEGDHLRSISVLMNLELSKKEPFFTEIFTKSVTKYI